MISCKQANCHMRYIGYTTTPLNKRLSGHRANIINQTEGKVMLDHFKDFHNIADMIIKPIFMCDKEFLRTRETFWIQELNTVFPYGLNNRIDINNIKDAYDHLKYNNSKPIYTLFNEVKNNRTKKGSGRNRNANVQEEIVFSPSGFINDMINSVQGNIHKHCRSALMTLQLDKIKSLFLFISFNIIDYHLLLPYNEHLIYVLKDICLYRLTKMKKEKTKSAHYIVLNFLHKNMDNIIIKKFLFSQQSIQRLPVPIHHLHNIGFTYKYTKTIRNIVTNYNYTVKNPDWNQQCICNQFDQRFLDQHFGHIITGNLEIIEDIQTRRLLEKGLNYRLPQKTSKELLIKEYTTLIEEIIQTLSSTIKKELFNPWKDFILHSISQQINNMPLKFTPKFNFNYLKRFQEHFVITPVDKASKNIGIICKAHYLRVLKEELLSFHFVNSNVDSQTVFNNYSDLLKQHYNIDTSLTTKDLPFIYWIPKFHKTPTGTRFITSGKETVINLLSKKITIGLKHMLKIEKNHCQNKFNYTGNRYFYITHDNNELIKYMVNQNLTNNNNKYIQTYDFKTLYTDIPQQDLMNNLNNFITSIYMLKGKTYLNIYNKQAFFSDKNNEFGSFKKEEFIDQVNYLILNAYIQFDNELKKLIIGIPTGTNCASDLANIFLHVYEKQNVEDLLETHRLNSLSNIGDTFRYQDDLINFNSHKINDRIITDIYPNSLTIQNTSTNYKHAAYLDLDIQIIDNVFTFKSYDKRRDFNFPITNFPNLHGNIPTNAAYGVFTSQLIRYSRINKNANHFITDTKNLVTKLTSQAFSKGRLKNKYAGFCKNYIHLWAHFGRNIMEQDVVQDIFS